MREYEEEARKMGWSPAGEEDAQAPVKLPPTEKQERMVGVSTFESDFVDEACAFTPPLPPSYVHLISCLHRPSSKLHELAIDGNAVALEAFLRDAGKTVDLNERDSYGYAALHLAVDRGASCCSRLPFLISRQLTFPRSQGISKRRRRFLLLERTQH
jgi:hypothetical protein